MRGRASFARSNSGRGVSSDLQQNNYCRLDWLLLTVLCLSININSLFGGFVFDDHEAIIKNNDVRSDTSLVDVFSNDFWGRPLSDPESHKSYRPLTILSFRLNYIINGLQPFGFHLTNILFHCSVSLLFLYVLVRAGIERDTARIAAMLFAVHPIHTEAVANVVGRAEILSALFYLLSFLSYLAYLDVTLIQDQFNTRLYYIKLICLPSALILSVVAMLCKEQGLTVLGVCLIYDIFVVAGVHLQMKIPSLSKCSGQSVLICKRIVVTCLCLGTIVLIRGRAGIPSFVDSDNPASFSDSLLTRTLTYMYLVSFNLWLLLSPSRLCFDWSMGSIPLVKSLNDSRNICTFLTFLVLILLLIKSIMTIVRAEVPFNSNHTKDNSIMISRMWSERKKKGTLLLGLLLLVIPFIPASNLLFPVGFVVAERILYLPSMGYCVLIALGITTIGKISTDRVNLMKPALTCFYVLLLMFSIKTFMRNSDWRDTESISLSALYVNPDNAKVYFSMGNVLAQQGNKSCEYYYQEALRLRPNYTLAWTNLGLVLLNMGRPKEAEECYTKALSIKPDHINANTNMAHLCRLQKRYKEALKHYKIVSRRRPSSPVAHYYVGWMLFEMGGEKEIEEAEKELTIALRLHPNYGDAHLILGRLLAANKREMKSTPVRSSKAINHLKQGLLLTPKSAHKGDDYLWLGKLLSRRGKLEEAKTYLFKAVQTAPDLLEGQQELDKVLAKLS